MEDVNNEGPGARRVRKTRGERGSLRTSETAAYEGGRCGKTRPLAWRPEGWSDVIVIKCEAPAQLWPGVLPALVSSLHFTDSLTSQGLRLSLFSSGLPSPSKFYFFSPLATALVIHSLSSKKWQLY